MNWDDEIERLIKSDFFFKMGETEQIDHVIFIKNVNEAFINPTEEAFENLYKKMNWLPSSLSDKDPFYGDLKVPEELVDYRKRVSQIIFQKAREMDKSLFVSKAHDFSNVAKMGMAFAFRQYLVEKSLSLGSYWENIVNLYYMGHWPIGYFEGILFAI